MILWIVLTVSKFIEKPDSSDLYCYCKHTAVYFDLIYHPASAKMC